MPPPHQTAPSPRERLGPTTPPRVIKRILTQHTDTHIESMSMANPELSALVQPGPAALGKIPVMRLVYGAVKDHERMPARAVSYALSALAVAAALPEETAPQLQIIHANHLGAAINGTDVIKAHDEAQLLASVVDDIARTHFPTMMGPGRLVHTEDTPIENLKLCQTLAEQAAAQRPKNFMSVKSKASNHAGDAYPYLGGHFAFQDTALLRLEPLLAGITGSSIVVPTGIVSIGGLKEKAFHQARQAMRASYPESELAQSGVPMLPVGQIFTLHKVPPYYTARGGEQSLEHAIKYGVDMERACDLDIVLDMKHILGVLGDSALKNTISVGEKVYA